MASPENILDRYASYTYYFELYANANSDELYKYEFIDNSKTFTDPDSPVGDLVLNSRTDAFQSIDEVRYFVVSSLNGLSAGTGGGGGISITIREPNGFSFVDKLQQLGLQQGVSSITMSMTWALKTMFVGRLPDGTIEQRMDVPLLLMVCSNIQMQFTEAGAMYTMNFVNGVGFDSHVAHVHDQSADLAKSTGSLSRSVSFSGRTVQEAVNGLQNSLNKVWSDFYAESGNSTGRKVQYQINLSKDINGTLDSNNKDTFGKNSPAKFAYEPNTKIAKIIHDILVHCSTINDQMIGTDSSSQAGVLSGKKIPTVTSSIQLLPGVCLLTYNVAMYSALTLPNTSASDNTSGSPTASSSTSQADNQFIFDYYFATPGKNVDVLAMDLNVSYAGLFNAIAPGNYSMLDQAMNVSGTLPKSDPQNYAANTMTPNTNQPGLVKNNQVSSAYTDALAADILVMPAPSTKERQGYATIPADQLASARLASKSAADAYVAFGNSTTIEIRGHFQLLVGQFDYPNGSKTSIMTEDGIFMKVNIYSQTVDPETGKFSQPKPFFYRGWWRVMAIENIFEGGMFKQSITAIAVNDDGSFGPMAS